MLKRARYNLSSVDNIIKQDSEICAKILNGKELLFSPYQTIKRTLIEEALNIDINNEIIMKKEISTFSNIVNIKRTNKICKFK